MTKSTLEDLVREYLGEYDTPSPDLSYRLLLRDRLRARITQRRVHALLGTEMDDE